MSSPQPKNEILALLGRSLSAQGLDVEEVEVSSAGRRKLVRVLVDKDGGVTLDDVAMATTSISSLLDSSDVLDDSPYTLEVTSPGVDRPLTEPRHWRRNVDRLVAVQLRDGGSCTGRIMRVSDSEATIDVDGSPRVVSYAAVTKARIEIEFNRPRPAAATPADTGAGSSDGSV